MKCEKIKIKNPEQKLIGVQNKIGSDLLSHTPAHAVPSAHRVLTALFGMGRGVSPGLKPPKILIKIIRLEEEPEKEIICL